MAVNYVIFAKPLTWHPQAQLVAWFSQLYGGQHATRCYLTHFRPDLLNLLLLEPSGSKFFCFRKFDLVGELIKEEAFGNLLSRLADRRSQVLGESGWSCDFFFFFYRPSGSTL